MQTKDLPRKNLYESAYGAHYVEAVCEQFRGGTEDQEIWTTFQDSTRYSESSTTPKPDHMVVVDLGTGSGGALRGLASSAKRNGQDLSNCSLIGIDISSEMLSRAQRRTSELGGAESIQWILGDASNLFVNPTLDALRHQVDLVILGDGGIDLFGNSADLRRAFSNITQLLRPGSGRAWVSKYEYIQDETNGCSAEKEEGYDDGFKHAEILSEKGIIPFKLRKLASNQYFDNGFQYEDFMGAFVGMDDKEKEVVLEIVEYDHKVRLWGVDEILQHAQKEGLESVSVKSIGSFAIFTFGKHLGNA